MKKAIKYFVNNCEDLVAAFFLSVMVLAAVFNVFTRYVLKHPFTWAEELECICLTWSAFSSAAAAYKKNLHFGMDFLVDHLPVKAKYRLRQFITLICVFLFAYLLYLSVAFVGQAIKRTIFFRLSYKYIDSAAIFGFASMLIYSILYFIESFKDKESFNSRYDTAYEEDNGGDKK